MSGRRFPKGIQRIQNFVGELKSEARKNPKLKALIILDAVLLAFLAYTLVYSIYYVIQHPVTVSHISLFN